MPPSLYIPPLCSSSATRAIRSFSPASPPLLRFSTCRPQAAGVHQGQVSAQNEVIAQLTLQKPTQHLDWDFPFKIMPAKRRVTCSSALGCFPALETLLLSRCHAYLVQVCPQLVEQLRHVMHPQRQLTGAAVLERLQYCQGRARLEPG